MKRKIKMIEDLSLNAWPSHQMQIYDSWILRFSYFYTHRTNSVEQLGPSTIPLREKINYCESIYEDWGTPTIFKISPLVDSAFDQMLAEYGYNISHVTEVMTMDLEQFPAGGSARQVHLDHYIPDEWIQGLFRLKGTVNPIHRSIVPSMYRAIPKETIAASIKVDGQIAATGLGILDREHIGLYAIHVEEVYRKMHWGHAICSAIIREGIRQGASSAYLQVVKGNTPAKNLYKSLGFQDFYTYWFRQKDIE